MRRLILKRAYLDLVASGSKRSTIRLGTKADHVGPTLLVAGDKTIPVEVIQVVLKRYSQLDEEDARLDGFADLEALRQALESFYPALGPEDSLSILHFRLVSAAA
ncbi:MAG TPA: ASCH domain-containing protein [Allosphingosinicella sp.]|jgi:hypothetical protein